MINNTVSIIYSIIYNIVNNQFVKRKVNIYEEKKTAPTNSITMYRYS